MSDNLSLSLPGKRDKKLKTNISTFILLFVIVAVCATILVITLTDIGSDSASEKVGKDAFKEYVVRLENQDLLAPALSAWTEYLNTYSLSRREQALIYYRIGTIQQQLGKYDEALAAFYRSESQHREESIAADLNTRVQKSLEALGKFAVLRRELADRTSVDSASVQPRVVASIGSMQITNLDLDVLIQELIDVQLSNYAGAMSREEIERQKEAFFSDYASQENRQTILESYLAEELLSTKARQLELHTEPYLVNLLERAERAILAQALIQRNLDEGIKISDVDLENHYRANLSRYVQPERARVQHILISNETTAREIHGMALAGESFADLAFEFSEDRTTAGSGGEIGDWVYKDRGIPGIGFHVDIISQIFSTDAGSVCESVSTSNDGYHIIRVTERHQERQKSFDEVRSEVRSQLYGVKRDEIQNGLMAVLRKEYDVVLYPDNVTANGND